MKKLLLPFILMLLSFTSVNANQVTVINLTLSCTFQLSMMGYPAGGGGIIFLGEITIPPGTHIFPDPTYVATYWADPSMPLPQKQAQDFTDLRGWHINPSTNSFTLYGPNSNYVSTVDGYFPTCNSGNAYTAQWTTNGNGDVVVLIF